MSEECALCEELTNRTVCFWPAGVGRGAHIMVPVCRNCQLRNAKAISKLLFEKLNIPMPEQVTQPETRGLTHSLREGLVEAFDD